MTRKVIIIENPSAKGLNLLKKLQEEKKSVLEKMRSMRNNSIELSL